MKSTIRLAAVVGLTLAATTFTTTSALAGASGQGGHHRPPVFVQSDDPAGNTVVAYHRAPDGTLSQAGVHATGGLGGILTGSVVDHLASEGSLVQDDGLLFAVNAGSNTVTTFDIHGDDLARNQVISSGGQFPVSITARGRLVYVLDARGGGSIQGYLRVGDRLVLVKSWHRDLGLDPAATPEFTHTAGQIGFTPDGSKLVVTTKAAGQSVEVFAVGASGAPAAQPVVNSDPGNVPFGFTFDPRGNLVLTEAGSNSVATFTVAGSGTLALISRVPTGQAATCWVTRSGSTVFASNAGSGSITGLQLDGRANLQSLGNTATDAGTVDAAATGDGRFLYVQTGAAGIVDEFALSGAGSATKIGSVSVPGAVGGQGISAG